MQGYHEFTVKLKETYTTETRFDELNNLLFEAVDADAPLISSKGELAIDVYREAISKEEALRLTQNELTKAGIEYK